MATRSRRSTHRLIGMVMGAVCLSAGWPARGQTVGARAASEPCLRAAQILDLAKYLASTSGAPDAYGRVVKAAFDAPLNTSIKIIAYEENRSFIYAVAGTHASDRSLPEGGTKERPGWIRRLIVLSPSLFIVDDELPVPPPTGMNAGCLLLQETPRLFGRTASISEASAEISILYPESASYAVKRSESSQEPYSYCLFPNASGRRRILQLLRVGGPALVTGAARLETNRARDTWELTVPVKGKIYKLTLPPPSVGAGEISITAPDGGTVLANRPLPSGVLPHGPEGNRLLELWDSDYRGQTPAPWDIGHPANELQKVVTAGTVRKCRAVDMCCGSGTDAIYLASKGFDVTAIDVAPTALSQAQRKAREAGVSVHWILADILAPPHLQPFDFVYDRGCYHVVRDQNLTAYIETVRKFSHPATQFLLLAARRDEQATDEPSGVTEEELRFDFLRLFDIESLRAIALESNRPGVRPPGWSALMKRNDAP